jgi:serine/threonine-protein kinase HipA
MSYQATELLHVFYNARNEKRALGRLAMNERKILFEYDDAFLRSNIEISPFKLPLKAGVHLCDDNLFDGLFGVFNDSLPDGWGRLLLDRQVERHGILRGQLTPLDRLAYVGENGMGALSYQPDLATIATSEQNIELDKIAQEAQIVLTGSNEEIFEELLQLNGSSGGARPKIVAQVNLDKTKIIHGLHTLKSGYEHWMIKFTSSTDPKDNGAIEYAYSLMANEAGINMPDTHLFKTDKGATYFGIKRFDREGNKAIHMHSLCGLIHADHNNPSLDYEDFLKVTLILTKNMEEVEQAFRLACFNVFIHNRDDHSKNFSFILDNSNQWKLSPAYDLTFSYGPAGEHSTMIMGEGKNPNMEHLIALAKKVSIKESVAKNIIEQVRHAVNQWTTFSDEVGVTNKSKKNIGNVIL